MDWPPSTQKRTADIPSAHTDTRAHLPVFKDIKLSVKYAVVGRHNAQQEDHVNRKKTAWNGITQELLLSLPKFYGKLRKWISEGAVQNVFK